MMTKPLVSVTLCAFNCEKFITQALDSILAQTYDNFEFIICDDASKDNTRTIIDSYALKDKRISTHHNDKNMGYLKTWNKLIAYAKGDFITFQDADDISSPDRFEKLLHEFKNNPEIGICGSNYIGIDESGKEKYKTNVSLTHNEIVTSMPGRWNFHGTAVMIKKQVYDTIGGYNDFFDRMGSEDHYWIYLITEKFKMKNSPDYLYYYRYNPHSVMGDLTTNSKKLFSAEILSYLISQRKETGTDDLESGNHDLPNKKLKELIAPFEKDKALFYYKIAKRRFYEGHRNQSIKTLAKAIFVAPWRFSYYKDLIYFIKN